MTDTYAVLEFQGYVIDFPDYDRDKKLLTFKAKPTNLPPMQFLCKGQLAQAFKSILRQGVLINASAVPIGKMEDLGGSKVITVSWEAKKITALSRTRVRFDKFAKATILDGLMPTEGDEIDDIGYVEPHSFGRFLNRLENAREEVKRRKDDD